MENGKLDWKTPIAFLLFILVLAMVITNFEVFNQLGRLFG
jgi:hypothetical protein